MRSRSIIRVELILMRSLISFYHLGLSGAAADGGEIVSITLPIRSVGTACHDSAAVA